MVITELDLPGVLLLEAPVYKDSRGCFYESFNQKCWIDSPIGKAGQKPFLQDNVSVSHRGVFRGMHLQRAPHAQSKLVRVLSGRIIDFVLDVNPSSPTYGKSIAISLGAHSGQALYIPAGYAHGFLALDPNTVLQYKVDENYHPESEETYHYTSVAELLSRYYSLDDLILSEKDLAGVSL